MKKALALLFLSLPAAAYYTPRNPHYESSGQSGEPGAAEKKLEAAAPAAPDVLGPGGWNERAREAIDALVAAKGFSSRGYSTQKPPVAVLSWEGVFFVNDAAGAVFVQMAESARFRVDDNFWLAVPSAFGRRELRAAYEQFSILPQSIWDDEPAYLEFRKGMIESYQNQCARESWSECRGFLAKLFYGFSPQEARQYAAAVINSELQRPLGEAGFAGGFADPRPVKVERGLREAPEISGLVQALLKAGFDVWVIDEDPQPALEAEAALAGIAPSRVIGIKTRVVSGILTNEIAGDVPARGAKTAAVVSALGRAPDLVVGASSDDAAILGYGRGLRVLIDHGDKKLNAIALKKHWILQPAFGH